MTVKVNLFYTVLYSQLHIIHGLNPNFKNVIPENYNRAERPNNDTGIYM